MENISLWILVALCVVGVALFLTVRVTKGGIIAVLLKTLASFLFVAIGILGAVYNGFGQVSLFILLGLLCGLIGDILLDLKVVYKEHNDIYLNSGMASFGLGHIFYFIGLFVFVFNITRDSSTPIYIPVLIGLGCSLLLSVVIYFATKVMKLNFGKFFFQSSGYTLLLTSLSAISICFALFYSASIWVFAAGATLFLLSDLVLSLNYFGGQENNKTLVIINHVLYYSAQILIAVFLSFILLK